MKKIFLLVITGLLTVALAMPAMAYHLEPQQGISTDFYASIGLATEYNFIDRADGSTADDTENLTINHSSVFGMMAKKGNVDVKWELGFQNWSTDDSNSVYTRHLYGGYRFNEDLKLTIGQFFLPSFWYTYTESRSGFGGMGHGALYTQRTPMIRVDYGPAYFIVAKNWVSSDIPNLNNESDEVKLPKVSVGFDTQVSGHAIGAGFEYNGYEVTDTTTSLYNTTRGTHTANINGENLHSWAAYVHGQLNIDKIMVKSQVWYGQNPKQLGEGGGIDVASNPVVNTDGDGWDDTKMFAGYLHARANLGSVRPFVTWGYASADNDTYDERDTSMLYDLGVEIDVWKAELASCYVVPEIAYWDRMDDQNGNDEEDLLVIGARWKVSF